MVGSRMVQDPKRRRTAVQPQVPQKTSVIGEYDFASKSGPYVEREAWLQNQEAKGECNV